MRILLTGATGVIGRRVIPLLVAEGHSVAAVGRSVTKREELERLGARGFELDLFDQRAVNRAVAGAEVICNLATAVPRGSRALLPWSWREMSRIRREASANLLNAALQSRRVRLLIQESFAPIYADAGEQWIDETSPVEPARYNRSVLAAEANAARFAQRGGSGVVLRFGLFYGPGDPLTNSLLENIKRGRFPLFGRPDGYTSWVAHDDAATAVIAALNLPSGIYNVVEEEPLRRRDLANGIAELLHVDPPRFLPSWMATVGGSVARTLARSLRISNRKFREASGWIPRYPTPLHGLAAVLKSAPPFTVPAPSRHPPEGSVR
jgi:nucleoside-diphosphate-sugar epimerase